MKPSVRTLHVLLFAWTDAYNSVTNKYTTLTTLSTRKNRLNNHYAC